MPRGDFCPLGQVGWGLVGAKVRLPRPTNCANAPCGFLTVSANLGQNRFAYFRDFGDFAAGISQGRGEKWGTGEPGGHIHDRAGEREPRKRIEGGREIFALILEGMWGASRITSFYQLC